MRTNTSTAIDTDTDTRTAAPTAREPRLGVYGVALAALVLPVVALAVSQGADLDRIGDAPIGTQIAMYSQAFMPALAALVACLAAGGVRAVDWGFHRVPWRTLAAAWAVPVLGIGIAYGTAWLTGAARFDPGDLAGSTGLHPALGVLLGLVPGVVPFVVLALGEQLGWSSLLVMRLAARRSPATTAVILGLAWAAFHYPLMLFVPGAVEEGVAVPYAMLMFTLQTVTLAFPLVWLRLRTRSIWPVLVCHATVNASLYFVAEAMTSTHDRSAWMVGEGGALTTAGLAVAVLLTGRLWRRPRSR
ncbi:CPBP family intramembrane metalloprotease [Microbispora cellulosiformans]|uniref:CPBP family intramembrane metalloprotease n=1 Tax=Microbispora cellulosiformans TaxID=2614688 RepID=A0A5J5KB11_9ACTN|nr:CPBP family intramembrane glutamic endopeptidase [Microbispora cellulosiformans]KAA9380963.1 CPBP family intramembrane metalloprotease [Microbispora cellulosiformans]